MNWHWLWYAFWVFVTAALVFGGIAIYAFLSAAAEVSDAPREEMFFCEKHGFLRKKHCITFMNVPYCSICFHSRMVDVERKYGG